MENKDKENELCDIGNALWHESVEAIDSFDEKYKKYVDHVSSCKECKRMLGIDDIILPEDLDKCDIDNDMGSLVLVERASISSYAEGIKDALIITAVLAILFTVGVFVFIV